LLPALSPLNSRTKWRKFVSRLPSVEELQGRFLIDDDAKSKEETDEFYGTDRKDFQLIDFSGRHPDPLRRKEMQRSLTRNGENGDGLSVWLSKEKVNSDRRADDQGTNASPVAPLGPKSLPVVQRRR